MCSLITRLTDISLVILLFCAHVGFIFNARYLCMYAYVCRFKVYACILSLSLTHIHPSIIHIMNTNFVRTLLRNRASEPCSLVIKVRAFTAHAPTLTFPGARTRCSRPSIGTVFVCDKGPSIKRTDDFLVVLSRYPSLQYQYGCLIVLLLPAIHKDIRLIFISPL